MAVKRVFLFNEHTKKNVVVELPDDVEVRKITEVLADRLNLPQRGLSGRPIRYFLAVPGENEELINPDTTLTEAGIANNQRLVLYPDMTAGSVLAGTKITLSDRKRTPIETLEIGQWILSYSTADQMFTKAQIVSIDESFESSFVVINDSLKISQSQLIYVNKSWQRADTLKIGDELFTGHSNELFNVNKITRIISKEKVGITFSLKLKDGNVFFAEDYLLKNIETARAPNRSPVLHLINLARNKKQTSLTLTGYGKTSIVSEMFYEQIAEFAHLRKLDLSYSSLTSLPPEIKQLNCLEVLILKGNRFSKIPESIFLLKNLIVLDLSDNQIITISRRLTELVRLRSLDLTRNRLERLPLEISRLENLDEIKLEKNPLKTPPPEILNQGTKAVKGYLNSLTERRKLFESKLLLVGEGGVGKTCLAKKLVDSNFKLIEQDKFIKTTEGIEITQWVSCVEKIEDFQINIWDFGGQAIYHATHQFFLTKRSLYLFVWDARIEDRLGSFEYWLNIIRLLSHEAPVLVVLNKADERIKEIDQAGLKEKFNNIIGFFKVSALSGQGIKELVGEIKRQVVELPHVGTDWPKTWAEIRYKLESDERDYLEYLEFLQYCKQFGLNKERADSLSEYLHDLGVILHFKDDRILKNIVILKPRWGTSAVYKVLEIKQTKLKMGRFLFSELRHVWLKEGYPGDKHSELLRLMERFELCFKMVDIEEYIVPQLLSPTKPYVNWNYEGNLRFEYHYSFMPAGIITRFIVRNHQLIKDELYWKLGIVLERENNEALIYSEPLNRKIKIFIRGIDGKLLLSIIRKELDVIHKSLNYLYVKEMIPCICSKCKAGELYFYNYEFLKKCSANRKSQVICEKSVEDVNVGELLGGVLSGMEGLISPAGNFIKIEEVISDLPAISPSDTYLDFDLHISPSGHVVANSIEGQASAKVPTTAPRDMTLALKLIEKRSTDADLLKDIGQSFYNWLFPDSIHTHLQQTEAVARQKKVKLRLRLRIENSEIARLPLELIYREIGGKFLAVDPDTVLSRYLNLPVPPDPVRRRKGPLHMLVIIADPTDQERLPPDEWEMLFNEALEIPLTSGQLTLKFLKRATRREIRNALLHEKPDIVQVVAHGIYRKGKGHIAFVNERTNKTWLVNDERFCDIFLGKDEYLGLICLATCESGKSESPQCFKGIAPKLVQRGLPAVVSMQYRTYVETAKVFLEDFYTSISARKPIDWAVQSARNAISLEMGFEKREFASPVLYMRAPNGNVF